MAGFQLPFGIQPVNPVPVDYWSGPYTATTIQGAIDAANAAIPSGVRFQTMEVRLLVGSNGGPYTAYKYWYATGTGNSDLIQFSPNLTGFVPYSGATGNVDLGSYNLLANAVKFPAISAPSAQTGLTFFDSSTSSLSYFPDATSGIVVRTGQQQYIKVYNATGSTINKGSVVKLQSATGGFPNATLANSGGSGNQQVAGLAASNILAGAYGLIINSGLISGINLTSFSIGDILYLSDTTPGGLVAGTSTLSFSSRSNQVGYVTDNSSSGSLHVSILNENLSSSISTIEQNIVNGNAISTGAYYFTGLSATPGGTTFTVGAMKGWIVYNTGVNSTNPAIINVIYPGATGISVLNVASADSTYVLVDATGTLIRQNTFPTPEQRRTNIYLGKILHPNRSTIQNVNNTVDFDVSPVSMIRDIWTPINLINQGIAVSANGANLNINTSGGTLWGNGINFVANQLQPNNVSISGTSPATFQYRLRASGTFTDTTAIDPGYWDSAGTRTAIGNPAAKSTNQRVYLFPTGVIRIQYGQTVYGSLAEAVAAIPTESFTPYPNNGTNAILIGIISLRSDASALNNTSQAVFTLASKFGDISGGTSGISTTNLQQAFDNSPASAELITNSANPHLAIQNGVSSGDSSSVLEILNYAGTRNAYITGTGILVATSLVKSGGTSSQILMADGSVLTAGTNVTISGGTISAAGGISGTGTQNYITKWTGTSSLNNSIIQDDGSNHVSIGYTTNPSLYMLDINGTVRTVGDINVHGMVVGLGAGNISSNLVIGTGLTSNTTGTNNIAIGNVALAAVTTGYQNIAIGGNSLNATVTNAYNTAIGTFSLWKYTSSLTATTYNTFIGYASGAYMLDGYYNTAIGTWSLSRLNGASINNTAIGYYAGANFQTGSYNVIIGSGAMQGTNSTTGNTGDRNTAIGNAAMVYNTSGQRNNAVGDTALNSNTTGSFNTANGNRAMQYNTTGNYNSAFGIDSLKVVNDNYNTALGSQAGISLSSGQNNTFVGYNSAAGSTGGSNNTIIGAGANGGTGINLGLTTGSYNTIIGSQITGLATGLSNNIILADGQGNIKYQWDGSYNIFTGQIKQALQSTLLKADANGVIVAAAAGTDYQAALTNPITGTGTANRLSYWTGSSTQASADGLFWDSTNSALSIGSTTVQSNYKLVVNGNSSFTQGAAYSSIITLIGDGYTSDIGITLSNGVGTVLFSSANVGKLFNVTQTAGSTLTLSRVSGGGLSNSTVTLSDSSSTPYVLTLSHSVNASGNFNLLNYGGSGFQTPNGSNLLNAYHYSTGGNVYYIGAQFGSTLIDRSYTSGSSGKTGFIWNTVVSGTLAERMRISGTNLILGSTTDNGSGILQTAGNIVPTTSSTYTLGYGAYAQTSLLWSAIYSNSIYIATTDYSSGVTGTVLYTTFGASTGNTYVSINARQNGGSFGNGAHISIGAVSDRILIGSTSDNSTGAKLQITGSVSATLASTSTGNIVYYNSSTGLFTYGALPSGGIGTTSNSITFNGSGSGATSPATFNGSSAITISYNSIGAQPVSTNLTSLAGLSYSALGFVKMSASGTFSLDPNVYLTSNQSITLGGDVSGTGATSITVAVNKIKGNTVPSNATGYLYNNGSGTLSWENPNIMAYFGTWLNNPSYYKNFNVVNYNGDVFVIQNATQSGWGIPPTDNTHFTQIGSTHWKRSTAGSAIYHTGGNVLIGTTADNSGLLQVQGSVSFGVGIPFRIKDNGDQELIARSTDVVTTGWLDTGTDGVPYTSYYGLNNTNFGQYIYFFDYVHVHNQGNMYLNSTLNIGNLMTPGGTVVPFAKISGIDGSGYFADGGIRWTSGGNLVVGTSSTVISGSYKLFVDGDTHVNGDITWGLGSFENGLTTNTEYGNYGYMYLSGNSYLTTGGLDIQGSNNNAPANGGMTSQVDGALIQASNNLVINLNAGDLYMYGINNSTADKVLYYNSTTSKVTYGTAPSGGGGGSPFVIPVPKILIVDNTWIDGHKTYAGKNPRYELPVWGINDEDDLFSTSASLLSYPIAIAQGFTQDQLDNYDIRLEMLMYKKASRKDITKYPNSKLAKGFKVAGATYSIDGDPVNAPWWNHNGHNFWNRSRSHAAGERNGSSSANYHLYNWVKVNSINQSINLAKCLENRFKLNWVSYRDEDGLVQGANLLCPTGGNAGSSRSGSYITNSFYYGPNFTPLRVCFRYIVWLPDENGGRGQILEGPLSRTITVRYDEFPFRYNQTASKINEASCCSLWIPVDDTDQHQHYLRCSFDQ